MNILFRDMADKGKNIALLLHMYQPAWQYENVLRQISSECYSWLSEWMAEENSGRVNLNINYSLVELLLDNGLEKIVENIGRGIEIGNNLY
jgi:hypothetical protein